MYIFTNQVITPENKETYDHKIEQLEYKQKTIEKGLFTTKSHDREYIEVLYTDGESGVKDTLLFSKEQIKIGDEIKLISKPSISDIRLETLYLTEDEYIDFFFEDPQNITEEEDKDINNKNIKDQ